MKRGAFWIALTFLIVSSLVLASCGTTTTTTTTTRTPTTTTTSVAVTSSTTTTTKVTTTPTSTASGTVNWWDKLGKPQYGGDLVIASAFDFAGFDEYTNSSLVSCYSAWMERLVADDWTVDPSVFAYTINFRPPDFVKGCLASSWEFPDPSTYVVHLRQGIHYQDKDPVNGREFTSADVVYHYDRLYGLGSALKPSPFYTTTATAANLTSVVGNDKYTVTFKWKVSNPEFIMETVQSVSGENIMEAHEVIEKWGDMNDWHHALGTGPFILKDFVSGGSMTLAKNPNYWGHDERYPQNQLPYVDTLKILIIPNAATSLAAMRTGKTDAMDNVTIQNAQSMQKTSPQILQLAIPMGSALTVDPRNDTKPYTDVRVRQALQMAIDLPTIAKTFYGGTTPPYPVSVTSYYETGWGLPYTQWSQSLKDQYAYNPKAAKQLLSDAGYPSGFKTDVVADSSGDLDLLQIVKSYFSDIGVDMSIQTMDSASWTTYVRTQKKFDALAYRSSGALGMSYEPLRQFLRYTTGYVANYNMVSDPILDDLYNKAMAATSVDVDKQLLIQMNERVAEQHYAISLLIPSTFALYQPWLKGFSDQNFSISGGSSGPLMLGFYASRYWIDLAQKKSMGY